MNPSFPFDSKFDRSSFRDQIRDGQGKGISGEDSAYSYQRSHGIKFIVEAPGSDRDSIGTLVQDIWGVEVAVEALFQRHGETPEVPEELRSFYLISIPNVAFGDLVANPYDAGYALLAGSDFRGVEPDLPYTRFLAASPAASTRGTGAAATDQGWSVKNVRADTAWLIPPAPPGEQDGKGMSVAHLDTGWTIHDDLDKANFDPGHRIKDFIDPGGDAHDPLGYWGSPGHGTETGSVIMSRGGVAPPPPGTTPPGNITGIARSATYVPLRCIKSVLVIYNSNIARAVDHATAWSCDVVSMSFAGLPMKALHKAIQRATADHLLVVCAAGNLIGITGWPANYKESIAVAASNCDDQPWLWTGCGPAVDISAPGEDVWKADADANQAAFSTGSGTSYSTATMAGVAALWVGFHEKRRLVAAAKKRGQVLQELFRDSIKSTARKPQGWKTVLYGEGIVDAERLLLSLPKPALRSQAGVPAPAPMYLDAAIQVARSLIRQKSDAFDHELAWIFLEEANDPSFELSSAMPVTPEHVREVVGRRGSESLQEAMRRTS